MEGLVSASSSRKVMSVCSMAAAWEPVGDSKAAEKDTAPEQRLAGICDRPGHGLQAGAKIAAGGADSSAVAASLAAAAIGFAAGLVARSSGGPQHRPRIICAAKKDDKKGKGDKGGKAEKGGGGGGGGEEEEIDTAEVMKDFEDKMDKALDGLQQQFVGIRAGRATAALLDGVKVNAYETQVSVKEVGTITAVDSLTLLIQCFEAASVKAVAKGIVAADLGFSVQETDMSVKVMIPTLTADKRAQYAKLAKDFTEKSKLAIRNVRQAALKK
ncbi:unnamed protein product, partial [Polarella glacialis]